MVYVILITADHPVITPTNQATFVGPPAGISLMKGITTKGAWLTVAG